MPFIAEVEAEIESETVTPRTATPDMGLACPDCADPFALISRHERQEGFVS
jgi:hypothetical protein